MAITEFHSNVCQAAVAALWGCRLLGSSQAFSLMLPICRTTKSNNIVANRQPTNLFFMCGRTNLGAKKERDEREENSPRQPASIRSMAIVAMQQKKITERSDGSELSRA